MQHNAGAEPAPSKAALMASIREIRKTLMPVVIALVLVDVICVGYLLSPAGRSRQARVARIYELRAQLTAKRQDVLPTRGMDDKLKQASTDIGGFYGERFPAQYSTVADRGGQDWRRNRRASRGGEVRRQGCAHRRACAN